MSVALNTSSLDIVVRDLKKFSTYEIAVGGFNRIGQGPANHVYITTDEDGKATKFVCWLFKFTKLHWSGVETASLGCLLRLLKHVRIADSHVNIIILHFLVPSQYPPNIELMNTSSTSLNVSWKAIPPEQVHGILRGYGIFYRAEHVHVWNNFTVLPNVYSLELTGLRKYQKYYMQVAGLTVKGIGKPCKQIPVLTDEDSKTKFDILALNE